MNNVSTVNLVIKFVGALALASAVGLIVLVGMGRPAAELLPVSSVATGALGVLGGLLANTKSVDLDGLQALADTENAQGPVSAPGPVAGQ